MIIIPVEEEVVGVGHLSECCRKYRDDCRWGTLGQLGCAFCPFLHLDLGFFLSPLCFFLSSFWLFLYLHFLLFPKDRLTLRQFDISKRSSFLYLIDLNDRCFDIFDLYIVATTCEEMISNSQFLLAILSHNSSRITQSWSFLHPSLSRSMLISILSTS